MSLSRFLDSRGNYTQDDYLEEDIEELKKSFSTASLKYKTSLRNLWRAPTNWVSWGDTWTKPAPYAGSIETFSSRLSKLTNPSTNSTYRVAGGDGLNISDFFASGTPQKWYYSANSPFYGDSTHIHVSQNDIFDSSADQANIYLADNLYSLHCFIQTMLFTCSLPINTIKLASQVFTAPTSISSGTKFLQNNSNYYGSIRTVGGVGGIANNDTLVSNSTVTGRYYFFMLWADTTNINPAGMSILLDGVEQAYVKVPGFTSVDYAASVLSSDVHPYPVFIDMETSAARTVTFKINVVPTSASLGLAYLASWNDTQGSTSVAGDKFRHVLIDSPPMLDMMSGNGSISAISSASGYPLLLQYQMRYYNILHAIEDCVRSMKALRFPVEINYWNNLSNAWISDYSNPGNSMAIVNARQIINLHANDIVTSGTANIALGDYGYSNAG